MGNMMKNIGKIYVKETAFQNELAEADNRNFKTFLSKADFKKNWTAVQKKLDNFEEKSRETIRIVSDNTEFMEKLKQMMNDKAEKKVVDDLILGMRNYASYQEMKTLY